MEMSTKKRVNFTPVEKEIFLGVVAKYKNIVENKSTKAFMVHKKNKIWSQIQKDFNCRAETGPRTVKQLKVLYDNLKREAKKTLQEAQLASNQTEIIKTEVGAPIQEQLEPLENQFDSGPDYFNKIEISYDHEESGSLNLTGSSSPCFAPIINLPSSVDKLQTRRKKIQTVDSLKKQYYLEKIQNEKLNRVLVKLQIKKIKLEINKL